MIVHFSLFTSYPKFEGIPIGRLYVSRSFLTHPLFLSWLPLFHVIGERSYMHGKCIWFIAPVSLYSSLASQYLNPWFASYTLSILKKLYSI